MPKFSKEELIQKLMGTFLDELDEHVQTLNDELLMLEKLNPGTDEYSGIVRSLFRATHSLKGAARSVDVGVVESLCHQLEDLMGHLKGSDIKPSPEVFQLLFQVTNVLGRAGGTLRQHQNVDQSEVQQLLDRLSVVCEQFASVQQDESLTISSMTVDPDDQSFDDAVPQVEATDESSVPSPRQQTQLLAQARKQGDLPATVGSSENQSMRVSAERLDKLLALSSEFLTSYRRSEIWQDTVEDIAERLRDCLNELKPLEKQLRALGALSQETAESEHDARRKNAAPHARRHANKALGEKLCTSSAATTRKLAGLLKDVDRFVSVLKSDVRTVGDTARLVDEEIRGLRMRPFSDACLGLQLAVRELAISTGKEVEFRVKGGDVELDRSVLESLKNPLLHIVRNAIQHGIERSDRRLQAGKSQQAAIEISASLCGSQVQIEIKDDGRGLDEERIRTRARETGFAEPQSQHELANLIFQPWFSTAAAVDAVAGRGVGLDVVANQVAALQGTVAVDYEAGKGTCFTLTVPLTLTKIRVIFVKVSGQTFALPSANVQRLVRIDNSQLLSVEGRPVLKFEGQLVPVVGLSSVLNIPGDGSSKESVSVPAVVLTQGGVKRAFIVDELVSEREVVVTNLGPRLQRVRFISGATLLGTGEIALILNASDLLRRAPVQTAKRHQTSENKGDEKQKRLIICDDSATTRILETSILQAAGYDVTAVADGQDAWELLQAQGADLIVSDVEMPVMDGFSLTRTIRASERWSNFPIILVTGLAKQSDREEGLKAGANAYVVKSEFDQTELLEAIEQLI